MRKNDKKAIAAAASAANLPTGGFQVDESDGQVIITHPESMKWSSVTRANVEAAVERVARMKATLM